MPWRGPEVEGEFPTLGYLFADWIEDNLVVPDGPQMGEKLRLYDEQLNHLLWKYRLNPKARPVHGNDAFMFGGSMLVRGQKWGKDPLLGAINLLHAYGPCDFDGWDADGNPVGRPHPSPWVAVAATNDEQTANTWLPMLVMIRQGPLADIPGNDVNDTFIKLPCGNPIEPITTTAFGRLGGRFTAASMTESGILIGDGPRGGLTFARTLKRNVGGMGGQWTSVTNTWDPTEHSDAQETFEAKDPHVYVDARLARKHVDIADTIELKSELRHLYGDSLTENSGHVSLQRLVRDCRNRAMGESEVRRFYLSEITSGEKDAVDPAMWHRAHVSKPRLKKGDAVALGFDGSRARDATSLIASRMSDGKVFHLKSWFPATTGGKVDRRDVDRVVRAAFDAYQVTMLFADPYLWQDYLDNWSNSWPKQIIEFPTNSEIRMDAAIELFLTMLRDGDLTHDGHDTLTEHAENAALAKGKRKPPREDSETGLRVEHYLKVVKKRDGLIDAFVAAILATAARGKALEDGWQAESKKSVYEKRGLVRL